MVKEYFICGPPEWRLNAKADPVALCNQVLGGQVVVQVLDDGTILAAKDLTPNEIKKILDINFNRHILDSWEAEEATKTRYMTPTQIAIAIDSAFPDAAQRRIIKRLARVALFPVKREMNEL